MHKIYALHCSITYIILPIVDNPLILSIDFLR